MNIVIFGIVYGCVVVIIFSRDGNKDGVVIFIKCEFGFLFCKFWC